MTGIVGAIFNGALQLGSAVGISTVSSIETSVETKDGGPRHYEGRAAAFWFLLSIICAEAIAILVFYRTKTETQFSLPKDIDTISVDEKEVSVASTEKSIEVSAV